MTSVLVVNMRINKKLALHNRHHRNKTTCISILMMYHTSEQPDRWWQGHILMSSLKIIINIFLMNKDSLIKR